MLGLNSPSAGQHAVIADAVKNLGQDMLEDAADELGRAERHRAPALSSRAAIVFVSKADAGLVHGDQAAVGNGDMVGEQHREPEQEPWLRVAKVLDSASGPNAHRQ